MIKNFKGFNNIIESEIRKTYTDWAKGVVKPIDTYEYIKENMSGNGIYMISNLDLDNNIFQIYRLVEGERRLIDQGIVATCTIYTDPELHDYSTPDSPFQSDMLVEIRTQVLDYITGTIEIAEVLAVEIEPDGSIDMDKFIDILDDILID